MKRYAGFRLAAILLLLISAPFCGAAEPGIVSEDESSLTFRQNDGTEVILPKRPGSTVICYSSLVQVWYAAGGTAVAIPASRRGTPCPRPPAACRSSARTTP